LQASLPRTSVAVSWTRSSSAGGAGEVVLRAAAAGTPAWSTHLRCLCRMPAEAPGPGHSTGAGRLQWRVCVCRVPAAACTGPLARVAPPQGGGSGFLCHPAAMDAGMHAGVLTGAPDGLLRVPGALRYFSMPCNSARKPMTLQSWAELTPRCASGALDAVCAPMPGNSLRACSWTAVSDGSGSSAAADASRLTSHWLMPESGSPTTLAGLHTHVSRASLALGLAGMHGPCFLLTCCCFHLPSTGSNCPMHT